MLNIWSICSILLITTVSSEPPPQYGPPVNNFGSGYNYNNNNNNYDNLNNNYNSGHNYNDQHGHQEDNSPKAYEFGYQVKDEYSGNNYNRQEVSDGNQVQGEYRVLLPDGRTQIVTYYADWQTGFHADVRYEGTAHYPETYNNNYNGNVNNNNNQYGAPFGGGNHGATGGYNNNYNHGNNGYNYNDAPSTSSVTIKDYSSNQGGYGDSYSQAGSFGNKVRPTNTYGPP